MLARWTWYIRRRETPLARTLYRVAKMVVGFNVPSVRFIHGPMYVALQGITVALRWLRQKLFYEPMFKARCAGCGRGLTVDNGLPLVSDHLQVYLGDHVYIGGENGFVAPAIHRKPVLRIGDRTVIGNGTSITVGKSVRIGSHCLIGRRVFIADTNGHPLDPARRHEKVGDDEIEEVVIEDNVWVGHGAFVGPGVRIGSGSIVAANSVVTKDVPANAVVMGSPARVVRLLSDGSGEKA